MTYELCVAVALLRFVVALNLICGKASTLRLNADASKFAPVP